MSKRKGNGNNEDIGLGCSEPEEMRQSITKQTKGGFALYVFIFTTYSITVNETIKPTA